MTDRFSRVRDIYEQAVDLPESERAAFLDEACAGDAALRKELDDLFSADREAGEFLREPAVSWAGRRIGDYEVKGVIAEGGMGLVLRAQQEQPSREVAIKLIRGDAVTPTALRRFKLEAEVLGRLDHPNIAQIFHASTTDAGHGEQPYIVMELVDGVSVTEFAERGRLATRDRVVLMIQICDAIHHAHESGVIHRDVKPGNVLVRDDGQPKVLDFGVARVTDADIQATTAYTDVGQVIGTLPYMSPEQVRGDAGELGARSDIYALGVLCYELLTGRLPQDLKGKALPEAARIIAQEDPETLSTDGARFPADLETIVGKCLEKEPARRYASAQELARDFKRYLDHQPIAARPPSAVYQFKKFARRNRGVVAAGSVAVMVLIAGFAVSVAGWSNAARQRERAQLEASKTGALNQFLVDMLAAPDPFNAGTDVKVAEVLENASQNVDSMFAGQPELAASVYRTLGDTYRGMGDAEKAEQHYRLALASMGEVMDVTEDPRALTDLFNLGNVVLDGMRMAEADSIGRIMENVMAAADPNAVEYLSACMFMGWIHEYSGRFDEGVARLRPCFETARTTLGPQHTRTLDLQMALGNCAWQAKQFEEARTLMEDGLEVIERLNGPEHPSVLVALNNLAAVYKELDEHELALDALTRGLEAKVSLYGEDNWSTAIGYHNLAMQLRRMERYQDAVTNHVAAVGVVRRILEEGDIRTVILEAAHAQTLVASGAFAEAEPILSSAYPRLQSHYGAEHPRCQSVAGSMAEMYAGLGRSEDAARFEGLAGE